MKPLAIDLFCGLGGWTEGLLAEGYDVIGFDNERHEYGEHRYPGQLVIQDALTLHGSQFKSAALIVASPPCQEYSYMAMPFTFNAVKVPSFRFDGSGKSFQSASVEGLKTQGHPNKRDGHSSTGHLTNSTEWLHSSGIKDPDGWEGDSVMRRSSSKSIARKMASALIAKIPLPLSRHIASTYFPISTQI